MKRIALSSWTAVRNAVVAAPQDAPAGALVVPVDDDDWFAPQLADDLRSEFDARFSCYLWRHYTVELRRQIRERLRLAAWRLQGGRSLTCSTNNYAVVKSPEGLPVDSGHGTASRYFDAHPALVKRIQAHWNLQNRNLSSRSIDKSKPEVTRSELALRLGRYQELYARLRLPAGFGWAHPYLEQMAALTAELKLRP